MQRRGRTGLTLAELTLGMAITVVIGGAVATLAAALSSAHAATENYHASLQTGRMSLRRVQGAVRTSKLILAVAPDTAVLWAGDANADGQINPSELLVLLYDAEAAELQELARQYPDGMGADVQAALEQSLPLNSLTNADATRSAASNDAHVKRCVLAENVTSATFEAKPDGPLARVLYVEMQIGEGDHALTLRSAAAPRAPCTDRVRLTDNGYTLE